MRARLPPRRRQFRFTRPTSPHRRRRTSGWYTRALPGDNPTADNYWENEDVEIDHKRKLVFMARERSALGVPPDAPVRPTGVYILSFANPAELTIISYAEVGTGHTTSCVNDCHYLWTAGYDGVAAPNPPYDMTGKIFVTDIRDPAHPKTSTMFVDENRSQGESKVTHDVQVDAQGVAWVAGAGGTRGYWTDGVHWDPLLDRFRRQHPPGSLLLATEEAFSQTCENRGRLVITSLRGSRDGDSWRATPEQPFYTETVSVWSPHDQDGTGPIPVNACSAHYFDVKDRVVVQSYYMQGTRFIDVSDPEHPRQVAYWRPAGAQSFTPKWHKGFAYVADWTYGLQILRLTPGAAQATEEVVLTKPKASEAPPAIRDANLPAVPFRPLAPDPVWGMICPMAAGRPCEPNSLSCC